jgi:outer membrane protein TolC
VIPSALRPSARPDVAVRRLVAFLFLGACGLLSAQTVTNPVVAIPPPPPPAVDAAWPLSLDEVLGSVTNKYPPLLAALIERDIARGRLRQARGGFDLQLGAKGSVNPTGYYEYSAGDFSFEQPTTLWGASFFGGYRLSRGTLPDYYKDRTQEEGEWRAGLKVPLLRDGSIDRRRAAVAQARLDVELADPFVLAQQLNIIRSAARAYFNWLAAGYRLRLAEELFRIAQDRDSALAAQAQQGLIAPIIRTDNERLVVNRRISVVQAQRRFEQAAIELSLFVRDSAENPIVPSRNRLPEQFPATATPASDRVPVDISTALVQRPEVRRLKLAQDRAAVDRRLAKNNLLPNLDVSIAASEDLGGQPYRDRKEFELEGGIEFKLPLQRREAKGRLEAIEASIDRLNAEEQFARDRIGAEIQDAFSAIVAAFGQIDQTRRNVQLAEILEESEKTRFQKGAADLLALQIREQATFDARLLEVEAVADFFRAQADYRAAAATDARALPDRPKR